MTQKRTSQNVQRLQELCTDYLDNADLDFKIDPDTFTLHMTFYAAGSDKKVIFECGDVRELSVRKSPLDRPFFPVMKTTVSPAQKAIPRSWSAFDLKVNDLSPYFWKVDVEGSLNLSVHALHFTWREERLSDADRAYFNTARA
jgi:hypothetical protein